ncbi:MAG: hypothetical protein AAF772_04625 [Acidobacteriota bacterium]
MAQRGETTTYGALADTLRIRNPRSFGHVFRAINVALNQLGDANGVAIPPIQFLVVRQDSGIPGHAAGDPSRGAAAQYEALDANGRRDLAARVQAEIFAFPHWDAVLEAFELEASGDRGHVAVR